VVVDSLKSAIVITAFVAVMMLIVEYLNVRSRGMWTQLLGASRPTQYLVAALLGATPGCLGAYVVVALYAHGRVTLGALIAAMIATSGGEALVMLALFPGTAALMTLSMTALGIGVAWITDTVRGGRPASTEGSCRAMVIHENEIGCFSRRKFVQQWKSVSAHRATLSLALSLVAFAVASGEIGPREWSWIRIAFLIADVIALLIIVTVSDHFLDEHLWRHIAKKHVPGIFIWTFGVMLVLGGVEHWIDINRFVSSNQTFMLLFAALVGIVPESGPHLLFVMLYSKGNLPLSVLVASSIVQDGHGMLPLLAVSRKDFFTVKLVNVGVGLLVGGVMLLVGY
jgi:hypothetical protein